MPEKREIEPKQEEVSAPPSWEPWTPEERIAAELKAEDETPLALDKQEEHVVELPQ